MNNNIVKVWSILSIVSLLFITITFLREIVFASCFGVTYFVDAYAIAAQIPEALFFVMCQALGAITIPIYSKLICTDGKTVADKFISNLISVISISLLLLIAICIVCSDIFIYIFAPGLPDATHKLAVSLLRWTLPILLFEIIIVMHISILNVHNVFIRPKLFSGIRFIVMIIMMVAFHKVIGIYSAVFGWLMGVIAELIAYLIISHKYRVYRFSFNLKDSNFIKAYKQAVPIVISSGVAELNQIADKIISSFLAVGSIASLGYASKISNIVYIVFINNIITICYPRLAKYYSLDQEKKLILFFSKSLRYIIIVCLPLIIGGSIFKNELITLAFGRGAFNLSSVNNIGNIFMCYLITTIFAAIVLMSSKVFIIYGDLRIILYNIGAIF